jgi:pimeloyl-ACP methyl ester carboxylesterase
VSQSIWSSWVQGMMGSVKAHYDCIKAFSETGFTEDLKKIDIPVMVMHGDDDQIVSIGAAGLMSAWLWRKAIATHPATSSSMTIIRRTRSKSHSISSCGDISQHTSSS